jgi:hypothetical protein
VVPIGCDFLDSGRYLKIAPPMCPRALQSKFGTTDSAPGSTAKAAPVKAPPGCKCVFVKNLPYEVTEEAVSDVFKVCVYAPCMILCLCLIRKLF